MKLKKSQPPKNTTKIRKDIIAAALDIAANEPWQFVAPYEIAMNARVTVAEVEAVFPTKSDILAAIINDLDARVAANFPEIDKNAPIRDRLFDVFMERFDMANRNRAAHISFFKSFGWTKNAACRDIKIMHDSMTKMAALAGVYDKTHIMGLMALYAFVSLTWIKDESPDLVKTMAQLDKSLSNAEKLLNYLGKK